MSAFPPRKIIADNVFDGMADAIGNTPLIRLRKASKITGCNIYGKAEFMNPVRNRSYKDRVHTDQYNMISSSSSNN